MKPTVHTRVALHVRGSDVEPELVAERLELSATASHRRGDAVGGDDPNERHKDGWCYFTSHAEIARDAPFDVHAAWLLVRLEPHRSMLLGYADRGWRLLLEVTTWTDAAAGGPLVSAETMRRLADLALPVRWTTIHTRR